MMTTEEFLASGLRNAWCTHGKLKVYLRKGHHYFDGDLVATLDVASVEVSQRSRGKGIFTAYLKEIEKLDMVIYIENVINGRLAEFFRRRPGYSEIITHLAVVESEPPCFFRWARP